MPNVIKFAFQKLIFLQNKGHSQGHRVIDSRVGKMKRTWTREGMVFKRIQYKLDK